MKLSGVTKMVKRQLVCNVFHNIKSDDFYIGTASAIYCATGFPLPLNRSQMGALLGISEDTMIEKVVYNDFDCAYKSDLEGFNLDDNVKNEVEVKKMAVGIYYMGETLIPLATEDKKMAGLICWSQLAPVEDEIKNRSCAWLRTHRGSPRRGCARWRTSHGENGPSSLSYMILFRQTSVCTMESRFTHSGF